tara:strand:+ start:815 stop:2533 length:1719 start_codon:yes stop_codon:yes gene_type:complete
MDGYQHHRVYFDETSNVIFDFKELNFQCMIHDSSYEAHSIMDFIEIDLSENITRDPSFVVVPHDTRFDGYHSNATVYVPKDLFQDLFLVRVDKQDVLDDAFDNMKFALDTTKWCQNAFVIPFHNSVVDASDALNPNARVSKRNIQNDFIRSMYFDLTGSLKFSAIFHNTNPLLDNMEGLDVAINDKLDQLLDDIGGTQDSPLTNADISHNPVRDFLYGMLNSNNEVKVNRKHQLIDTLSQKINTLGDDRLLNAYFIQGFSFRGYGHYYPVYTNRHHPDLYIGYKKIRFAEYGNKDFYINIITINQDLNDDSGILSHYVDYEETHNVFVSLPFEYGDGIQSKITYFPHKELFVNQTIHPRSYKVTMILSLESNTQVGFTDVSLVDDVAMLDGEHVFEMLWLGSEDRSSSFFSHYHYYPTFETIDSVELKMNVYGDGSGVNGSGVDGSEGIGAAFVFYARPRAFETEEQVKVDKVMYYIPDSKLVYDTMHTYTNDDFSVLLNNTLIFPTIQSFLETRINLQTSFKPNTHFYGGQQLLQLTVVGKNNGIAHCALQQAHIQTKDGRTITLSNSGGD